MSDAPAQLIMQRGPDVNQIYELTAERLQIGRSADNPIAINDAEVSRRHAQLVRQPDGNYTIEDLGSTNGTFINGVRIQGAALLTEGDTVDFGDSIRLVYAEALAMPEPYAPDEEDTADLEPITPSQMYAASQTEDDYTIDEYEEEDGAPPLWAQRRVLIGCGVALLLFVCLCSSTLFLLDWYRQGELLYCGGLRPLFETLLNIGPLDFSPAACPAPETLRFLFVNQILKKPFTV